MNIRILEEDIRDFVDRCDYRERFRSRKIVITGATGLIGSLLTKCLIALNEKYQLDMGIYCVVRNIEKAQKVFPVAGAFFFFFF